MNRETLMLTPIGELRKLKELVEDVIAERAQETKLLFSERLAALREEMGMPARAPMKRRKKRVHREIDGDKPVGNGASP